MKSSTFGSYTSRRFEAFISHGNCFVEKRILHLNSSSHKSWLGLWNIKITNLCRIFVLNSAFDFWRCSQSSVPREITLQSRKNCTKTLPSHRSQPQSPAIIGYWIMTSGWWRYCHHNQFYCIYKQDSKDKFLAAAADEITLLLANSLLCCCQA